MGRSNSYEDLINSNLDRIKTMLERGKLDKEIATELGIAYSTFKKYKSQNVALKEIIATIRDNHNQEVEKALYKKAIGYDYYEDVVTKVKEEVVAEDGKTVLVQERVKISSVKKHSSPDIAAQKFWLQNRSKAKWVENPHKNDNEKKGLKIKEKEIDNKAF